MVVQSVSGQKSSAVCSGLGFKRNSVGGKNKMPLCLRVHADDPVEDRSSFIALEKGDLALKC